MRAVLFDVDGVLLNSAPAHHATWSAWAASHGLDPQAVIAATPGRRPESTVAQVAPHLDPAVERALLDELARANPVEIEAYDGAAALLEGLAPDAWAIVTSGSAWYVREKFARLGLVLPKVQVFGEDVAESKPSPAGYLLAARLLGLDPAACLVLEDSPSGVIAGKAAGCRVVAVRAAAPVSPPGSVERATRLADQSCADLLEAGPIIEAWLSGRTGVAG
jgi:sugar-phosphatase